MSNQTLIHGPVSVNSVPLLAGCSRLRFLVLLRDPACESEWKAIRVGDHGEHLREGYQAPESEANSSEFAPRGGARACTLHERSPHAGAAQRD